jgi:hypothetical protein
LRAFHPSTLADVCVTAADVTDFSVMGRCKSEVNATFTSGMAAIDSIK